MVCSARGDNRRRVRPCCTIPCLMPDTRPICSFVLPPGSVQLVHHSFQYGISTSLSLFSRPSYVPYRVSYRTIFNTIPGRISYYNIPLLIPVHSESSSPLSALRRRYKYHTKFRSIPDFTPLHRISYQVFDNTVFYSDVGLMLVSLFSLTS